MKIGLAIGQVSWGILASLNGHRATYYFQGPAVDGCAEAEHHATAGDIVMNEQVREFLSKQVIVEPVNDHFRLVSIATETAS